MKPIYFTLEDAIFDIKDIELRNEIEYLLARKIKEIKEDKIYEYEDRIDELNEQIEELNEDIRNIYDRMDD